MEPLQSIFGQLPMEILNSPRGFMKILQFIFTICAFATTTSFLTTLKLAINCVDGSGAKVPAVASVPISYNFQLGELKISACPNQDLALNQDFSSDSSFFVAVGVLAFLYAIAALVFYVMYKEIYDTNPLAPLVDLAVHCLFTVLFLAASSAWANSLRNLKYATTLDAIVMENPGLCGNDNCTITQNANFSKLNISILLGFLNMFLFGCNLWFVYKETSIFKDRQQANAPAAPQPQI